MKKTLLALPFALAACFAGSAQAEPTDLGGGFSLSGNATIVSDYRFRGYSQTDFRPAVQLGFDLNHSSGFYLGNWNTGVFTWIHLYLWPTLIMLDVLLVFVIYLRYLARRNAPQSAHA